ncbi:MAG: hypothetical protein ACLFUB_20605 [Cyclobacteriaceae bacterium]
MKKILILALVFLLVNKVEAGFDTGLWCNGKLILEDGRVRHGAISYDVKFEVVRIQNRGMTRAYTAENVAFFEIDDPIKNLTRRFVALPSQVYPGYERRAFFEVISHGELSMLRKSEYVRRPRATEDMRAPHVYLNVVCNHTYYIHHAEEGLVEIQDFKEQVLPRMARYQKEVDKYISDCRFRLQKLHEQVRVFNLYNQLSAATEERMAANTSAFSSSLGQE